MRLLFLVTAILLMALPQPAALQARFIGNMAVALSDGAVTIMSDFPYQSGYSRYMTYSPAQIQSATAATLSLITHRHADHWDRPLFEKTGWHVAGPADVVSTVAATRVVPLAPTAMFGAAHIEPLTTPHDKVDHYSYVVSWHGRRLYFSGDTESVDHLLRLKDLDVAFVSPWLYRTALRHSAIDARRIVIYHHEDGEAVPECRSDCMVPRQGEAIDIR